ncbi:hypothetical protein [Kibdelosporangium aridum]|uniref:hypothetical protein n=1 Tax=Kibdelosporangium aridum TaxID=2030 RepID=UPI001F1E7F76|nr:hypothetical protein [Kibdelosporangium aridum]
MTFADDQQSVGEFASYCADESLGVAVCPWAAGRDLDNLDACAGEDGVECDGELPGAVADQEPEADSPVAYVDREVAGLLGGPWSVGICCGTEMWT